MKKDSFIELTMMTSDEEYDKLVLVQPHDIYFVASHAFHPEDMQKPLNERRTGTMVVIKPTSPGVQGEEGVSMRLLIKEDYLTIKKLLV